MITIAIPFYNAEKYLSEAIESVLNQTYKDFEFILLDDGSTDNSLNIAKKYEYDTRVRVISDGENKNLGYRLNEIAQLTKTHYLVRMDADDIMHPKKLEHQMDILKNNPHIDVLGTNVYVINQANNVVAIRLPYSQGNSNIIECNTFMHPTIIGKTSWFLENPYDVDAIRLEDLDLWKRTSFKSKFFYSPEPLLFYREGNSDYFEKYIKALPTLWKMCDKHHYELFWLKTYVKYLIMPIVFKVCIALKLDYLLFKRRNAINFKEYLTIEELLKCKKNN